MTTDNDMIRRGDALAACQIHNSARSAEITIAAMPAAAPAVTVKPVDASPQADPVTKDTRVEALIDLLCLADKELMKAIGCFPIDRVTDDQRFMNDACKRIRAVTGEVYGEREQRARRAIECDAPWTS